MLLFLQSMHVWFLWGNLFKIACPLFFLFAAYNNHKKNPQCYQTYSPNDKTFFLLIIAFISFRGSYDAGVLSICKSLVGVAVLCEVIKLNRETGTRLLIILTKIFGIISLISLIGWILFLFGISLPNNSIVDDEFGYSFENYYIFLYNRLGIIPRFCSIFLEPGYYGQLASIILFANKMKLNNIYLVAIFISIIFSLSLAGYVLVIIGFLFTYIRRENIIKLCVLVAIGYFSFNFFQNYNGGDNPVNDLIFARLEIKDGKLAGDDRSTDELDKYLKTTLLNKDEFLFGVGSAFSKMDWGHGVAGYKAYIVENGYVGLILAILGYLIMLYRHRKPNIHMKLCFILFMAMYWQAAYPYWFGFFSIYVFSLSFFSIERENKAEKVIFRL